MVNKIIKLNISFIIFFILSLILIEEVQAKDTTEFGRPTFGKFTSPFGYRDIGSGTEMHRGIDIANPIGTPIYAALDGVVVKSEQRGDAEGHMIYLTLHHTIKGKKYTTHYAHLDKIGLPEGTKVKKGQKIGVMGTTGRSTGSHLHFQVHEGHTYFYGASWDKGLIDPATLYPDTEFTEDKIKQSSGPNEDETDTSDDNSGKTSDGDYTGNLEFDPFIKGKPVQNNTGIDKKDEQLSNDEAYIVSDFFQSIITISLIVALVMTALYIIMIAVIILGIAMDSDILMENKLLNKVAGEEFVTILRNNGLSGSSKFMFTRFFVPVLILLLVVVGMLGEVQAFVFDKVFDMYFLVKGDK